MAALRPDKQVERRDLLRRLVGAVEPRDSLAESRRVVFGRGLVSPLKRERILDRIGVLAANLDRDIPPSLMPAIKIGDGCEINGLCAAICPTGALQRNEDETAVSLEFAAAACIICGECQRACPSKALSLWPQGDGTLLPDSVTLVERGTAICASCGSHFVAAGDEHFCPPCRKTMNVVHDIASLRFGSPVSIR